MYETQMQNNQMYDTGGSAFLSPMSNYGSTMLLITNPENELYKLELTFRSARQVNDNKVVSIGKPMMNELGISSIIGMTQSIVNQITIFSDLGKADVAALHAFFADTLAKDLMMNSYNYGITSVTTRDKVYFATLSQSYICMRRAYNEGLSDKKFFRGSVQEIHSKVEQSQGKRGGFFSTLNPWKK